MKSGLWRICLGQQILDPLTGPAQWQRVLLLDSAEQVCSVRRRFPPPRTNTAACGRPPPNPFPWKLLALVNV